MTYSGGEVRMSGGTRDKPWVGLSQGTLVGYRLIVTKADDRTYGAEMTAKTMQPLLALLQQFEDLGYQFVRLEAVHGS